MVVRVIIFLYFDRKIPKLVSNFVKHPVFSFAQAIFYAKPQAYSPQPCSRTISLRNPVCKQMVFEIDVLLKFLVLLPLPDLILEVYSFYP
jgi:hypothetical protein